MKIRVLVFALLSATLAVDGLRAAESHSHGDETELGEHMDKLGRAFRALRGQVADPARNEESLKLIATIRAEAEKAAALQPAKAADIPEDQRPKFVAAYGDKMKNFIADIGKLETALKAGSNEEAAALLKTLKADQDDGHKQFQKKKEKKEKV